MRSDRHPSALLRVGAVKLGPAIAFAAFVALALACGFPARVTSPVAEDRTAPDTLRMTTVAPPEESTTPTFTVTASPTRGPARFTTNVDANCRAGPGTVYGVVRVLPRGTSVLITGKDPGGTWYYVGNGAGCWVSSTTGTTEDDGSDVPVLPVPPTPAPTATPTPTITPTLGLIFRPPVTFVIPFRPVTASVSVDRTSYTGACPYRANWSGTITAAGATTVAYIWETASGGGSFAATMQGGVLTFTGAGTQPTVPYWLQTSSDLAIRARLHVTSPSSVYSNEAGVTIDCTS
jgi:hypothetical protein